MSHDSHTQLKFEERWHYCTNVGQYTVTSHMNSSYFAYMNESCLTYAADILRATALLHKCGIVHRDIKPANLLISESPRGQVTMTHLYV